jgi:hypothetical protein
MLSAQKEQIRLAASTTPEDLADVGSFGKVVNSIQGLQQRLENFGADDVGAAHDKTQTLLTRLADLQQKLTSFTMIKKSMTAVRVSVDQMITDSLTQVKLEAAEQPLHIQTLIQANKLIQFPRLNRSAAVSSLPLVANVDQGPAIAATADNDPAQASMTKDNLNEPVQAQPQQKSDVQPAPQEDNPIATTLEEQSISDASILSRVKDRSAMTGSAAVVAPESRAPSAEKQEADDCDWDAPQIAASNIAKSTVTEDRVNEALPVTAGAEFDQRLLDDLIKNYGEFAASLSPSRATKSQDVVETDSITTVSADNPPPDQVAPERNNLPSIKKEGDIDRQLKKIIKDYGEYDLYSRQGPVNLKTGVVAAFLLLGLILSGFYYFSPAGSQNSPTTPPAPIHSPNATESKERQNVATQPGTTVGDTGTLHGTDTNSRSKNRK